MLITNTPKHKLTSKNPIFGFKKPLKRVKIAKTQIRKFDPIGILLTYIGKSNISLLKNNINK